MMIFKVLLKLPKAVKIKSVYIVLIIVCFRHLTFHTVCSVLLGLFNLYLAISLNLSINHSSTATLTKYSEGIFYIFYRRAVQYVQCHYLWLFSTVCDILHNKLVVTSYFILSPGKNQIDFLFQNHPT